MLGDFQIRLKFKIQIHINIMLNEMITAGHLLMYKCIIHYVFLWIPIDGVKEQRNEQEGYIPSLEIWLGIGRKVIGRIRR